MSAKPQAIVVLAAVIEWDGRFLVTRRLKNTHLSGYWEFPGGKCEAGESHDDCLARELREELDVTAVIGSEILVTEHSYPDRTVRIHFRSCEINGKPKAMLGQEMQWVTRNELAALTLPPADDEVVGILTRDGDSQSR